MVSTQTRSKVSLNHSQRLDNLAHNLGTWCGVKVTMSAAQRTKKGIQFALARFMWRRFFAKDLWGRLLYCLARFGWRPDSGQDDDEPGEEGHGIEEGQQIDLQAPLPEEDQAWESDTEEAEYRQDMLDDSSDEGESSHDEYEP